RVLLGDLERGEPAVCSSDDGDFAAPGHGDGGNGVFTIAGVEEIPGAGLVFAEDVVFPVITAGGGVEAVLLRDGDGADGAAGGVGAGLDAVEPEDVGEDAPAFDGVRAVVGDGDVVGGAGAVGAVDGAEA